MIDSSIERALNRIRDQVLAGQLDSAEIDCRQLIAAAPEEADAWSWLGLLMSARGRWPDAESALQRAVELRPAGAHFWTYLSVAVHKQGRAVEAESFARQALSLDQQHGAYWFNLGEALFAQQRNDEALEAYRQAVTHDPYDAAAWQALASLEHDAGNLDTAQEAYERSLAAAPGGQASIGYAHLLSERGQPEQAIAILTSFLKQVPGSAVGWMVLANISQRTGNAPQFAEAACRHALSLAPQLLEARQQLTDLLAARSAYSEAEAEARRLVADNPQLAAAYWRLGSILSAAGRAEEAASTLIHALRLEANPQLHSRLLAALQYGDDAEPKALLSAHKEWRAAYALSLPPLLRPNVRRPSGHKLTLGFVSANFRTHPIAFLALPFLEQIQQADCRVVCYSDQMCDDEYSKRFRAAAKLWHETGSMSDDELAEQIQRDEIDVLVDLEGHVGRRLLVFARKPAPLQLAWVGYPGTTGLPEIDYLVADRYHIRPEEDESYAESILRLPNSYTCYGPPLNAPSVGPLPALNARQFTFGSFNHPAKLSSRILDLWSAILRRVPTARLFLKFLGSDEGLQSRLRTGFIKRGVTEDRILFEGGGTQPQLMASYNQVDLALDTQPYSGGVTTCEALWMGVPVITFPGKTFAGRHSTSYLINAGYSEFVANDAAQYVELAVQWAHRVDELAVIRGQMRERVRNSPLCDAPRFARDFLAAIHQARAALC